jgi:antitoxin component of MazEF toxin-antitoxin module
MMQAAAVPSSPAVLNMSGAEKPSARTTGDFGATLAESMSGSASVTGGKETDRKKASGKGDPKIQEGDPSSKTSGQTASAPTMPANPLPVELVPNPGQLALMFVPPQGATPQLTTEDKSAVPLCADAVAGAKGKAGEEIGGAAQDPHRSAFLDAVPLPANLLTQASVAPGEEVGVMLDKHPNPSPTAVPVPANLLTQTSVAPGEEVGVMLDRHLSSSPDAVPIPANLLTQTSVAPGEDVSFTADTPKIVNVQVTASQPQAPASQSPLVEAHNVTGAVSEELRPQLINTIARIFHLPPTSQILPPLAPVPDAKLSPDTDPAKLSRPSTKSENSSAMNSSSTLAPSTTRPPPSEAVLAQAVQLGPGAPLPPQQIKVSEGQNKTQAGSPTLKASKATSPGNGVAQVPEQVLADSGTGDQTPRPTAIEATLASKDDPEKKAADSSPQSSKPTFAPVVLTQEAGTTVVVSADAASTPPPHAPTSEKREVPQTQQMLDSAPAGTDAPPAARISTEPGGAMQMHVGIRTTAFGAVEIYTSVHQNQVELAVRGEHGLAHWFSSEVPNIESGLKDHRLNLTTLELDSGSTGLQTATSSDHRHPQRNFSTPSAWRNNLTLDGANETELVETATPLPSWSETRVSIHI